MQQIFAQKLRFADFTDDWVIKNLGDITNINTGKKDVKDKKDDGKYPFFTCAQAPIQAPVQAPVQSVPMPSAAPHPVSVPTPTVELSYYQFDLSNASFFPQR